MKPLLTDVIGGLFPVAVSDELLAKCQKSDALAKQFIPSTDELNAQDYELVDPIGDQTHSPLPGVIHRYPDRVLLLPRGNCPSYCRFCFRKSSVGKSENLSKSQIAEAVDYIRSNSQVHELILSGGEPLTLSAAELRDLIDEVMSIEHIDYVRIHTRLPITSPELTRVFDFSVFENLSKPLYVAIHCNHADEIDDDFIAFVSKLRKRGVILLSQTVLLKGVNDSTETLENLFRKLVGNGIRPYYLHHLDRALGTSHFRVSLKEGRELFSALRGKLSGIALPTYILDLPGGEGKIPAESEWLSENKLGNYTAKSPFNSATISYLG